jgi:hypothetical protein
MITTGGGPRPEDRIEEHPLFFRGENGLGFDEFSCGDAADFESSRRDLSEERIHTGGRNGVALHQIKRFTLENVGAHPEIVSLVLKFLEQFKKLVAFFWRETPKPRFFDVGSTSPGRPFEDKRHGRPRRSREVTIHECSQRREIENNEEHEKTDQNFELHCVPSC